MDMTLIAPVLLLAFALIIAITWGATRGQFPHLLRLAAGFGLFGAAVLVQFTDGPMLGAAVLYIAGTLLVAHGVLMRAGRRSPTAAMLLLGAAVLIGSVAFVTVVPAPVLHALTLNFGLGFIVLYAVWRGRRMVAGSTAEKLLFWAMAVVGVQFFPRTLITMDSVPGPGTRLTETEFWLAAVFTAALFAVVVGVSVLFATALDVFTAMQEDRETDELTGVRNRRGLDEELALLARRQSRPLAIVMADIDRFKRVNDSLGHAAGDEVLRRFSQCLRDSLRYDDIAARIGGEEFVAVLPATSLADATRFAERLREAVEGLQLDDIAPGLRITCSFGVIEQRAGEASWDAIGRADVLLYEAKAGGRNRVVAEGGGTVPEPQLPKRNVRRARTPPAGPTAR